uniref:Chondroitin proteoglycan 4 domain-containing protein n=1 Tax=Plectus sambesii TaxID=2011161 RepID=A0A914V253_9BILA
MYAIVSALLAALFVQLAVAAPATKPTGVPDSMMMIERTMSVGELDQFMVVFGVSPCMAACAMKLDNDTNTNTTETEDPQRDFNEMCDNYLKAAECFQQCPEADDHLFDIISSGADFMCVEQREAFERAMPCIRENKKALKEECRQVCALDEEQQKVLDEEDPVEVEDGQEFNNSSALFAQVGVLCEVMHCSIICGRDYLNQHCDPEQHVGSLVTESIIRPLEKNAQFMEQMGPDVKKEVKEALPETCGFIVDTEQLNALRGGPAFDGNNNEVTTARSHSEFTTQSHSTSPAVSTSEIRMSKATTPVDQEQLQRIESRERRSFRSFDALPSSGLAATNAFKYYM